MHNSCDSEAVAHEMAATKATYYPISRTAISNSSKNAICLENRSSVPSLPNRTNTIQTGNNSYLCDLAHIMFRDKEL